MLSEDGKKARTDLVVLQKSLHLPILLRATQIFCLDINALPRSLYMPMLAKLLHLIDGTSRYRRSQSACSLQATILPSTGPSQPKALSDDATYLHGFESGIEQEATAGVPKVWMPILGEGKISHLMRIYYLVDPC